MCLSCQHLSEAVVTTPGRGADSAPLEAGVLGAALPGESGADGGPGGGEGAHVIVGQTTYSTDTLVSHIIIRLTLLFNFFHTESS